MKFLLGIDIGTSGTKTVLFDESGKTIVQATYGYDIYQPQVGWAEQNPEDWWQACVKGIREIILTSGIQASDIKGIGLSGQMHGLVLLNNECKVIRNSIIWCDQRTEIECQYMTQIIGRERLIKITGNPALTGFTLSKLLWVRNNEPENYKKIYKILLPKDYIRYRLTGIFATDVSDASGMQILDISTRQWSEEVLSLLDIDKNILPKVYESTEITGATTEEVSTETNLAIGTPVVGGAGDQAAGAVGNGIVNEGVVSTIVGSSGVVFATTDIPRFDVGGRVHTLCHAVPGKWHIMGVTQSAGLSLKWFKENFCNLDIKKAQIDEVNVYDLLTKKAEKSPAGANGVIFLPYLMGERTPHLDSKIKGGFIGVSLINSEGDFIRSVLEGVGFSLKNCLDIIEDMEVHVNEIRISGGGAESGLWTQIISDIFQKGLSKISASDGPALGVAILAGVGVGIYPSVEEACDRILKGKYYVKPNENLKVIYEERYNIYNSLYPKIKDIE